MRVTSLGAVSLVLNVAEQKNLFGLTQDSLLTREQVSYRWSRHITLSKMMDWVKSTVRSVYSEKGDCPTPPINAKWNTQMKQLICFTYKPCWTGFITGIFTHWICPLPRYMLWLRVFVFFFCMDTPCNLFSLFLKSPQFSFFPYLMQWSQDHSCNYKCWKQRWFLSKKL